MASDGERRMVFDIRGRRRHVVKFVYGVLALLMGASLFLVVGPVNITGLFETQNSVSSAASALEEQADHVERKLKKNPHDEELLSALVRARVNAGNASVEIEPTTQQQKVPSQSLKQFQLAGEAWEEYLKQAGAKAAPSTAQRAATAFFTTAQYSPVTPQTNDNIKAAAKAQKIYAQARPNLGTLSTLAIYQYFAFDFAGGDKTAKQVLAETNSKSQRKEAEKQLATYRKQAKKFEKTSKEVAKAQKGTGKEKLENPLGGLSGGGLSSAGSTTVAP